MYRIPNSTWKYAPIIVQKERQETINFHSINSQTRKNFWPMPNADPMLAKLVGASMFFKLGFIHWAWQRTQNLYCRISRLFLRSANQKGSRTITNKVQYCCRMIASKGIQFNLRGTHYHGNFHYYWLARELVHRANWMRTRVPKFSELVKPLQDLLERQYSKHNIRKKSTDL